MVVDYGSSPETIELVKKLCENDPRIKLIQTGRDLGCAGSYNLGARISKGEYIALLNNDTEVDERWLSELVKVMEGDPTIGAAQSKLLLMSERDRFDYAGDYLSPYGFLIQRVQLGDVDRGQVDHIAEIFNAKGAAAIFRRKVLDETGLLDEDYFLYVEDVDLSWRVWLSGYRVVFVPKSVVYHAVGSSGKVDQEAAKYNSVYHRCKNYIATLLKNLGTKNLPILVRHICLWFALSVRYILGRDVQGGLYILKAICWNLRSFRSTWRKREIVQNRIRKVSDRDIMWRVMKRMELRYFYEKLSLL
jgi:hypothetical protein